MNQNVGKLFFIIKNNEVIECDSNLKDLVSRLPSAIAGIRSYDYYYRQFTKSNSFQFEFNSEYHFQKKEYSNGKEIA